MQNLSPEEQQRLQKELGIGESIVWAGKPNPSIIFHPSDWYVIPFSLMWGGFAIFWEASVAGITGFKHGNLTPSFFMLWGIPFLVIGQYLIWGRFFYAAWKKKRILYAITNRRILVVTLPSQGKTISCFIKNIPAIDQTIRSDGIGTMKFGPVPDSPFGAGRKNSASIDGLYLSAGVPVFVDIDDAASVGTIVADLQARLHT